MFLIVAVVVALWSTSPAGAQTFTSVPSDQIVRRGSRVSLSCVATNVVVISWNRNGNSVKEDAGHDLDITNQNGQVTARLTILSIQDADAGTYRCHGFSSVGSPTDSKPFTIQLATAPVVKRQSTPVYANDSGTATLECLATGIPVPTLTWSKDGLRLKRQASVTSLRYTMRFVTRGDAGSYQCLAENVAGSHSGTFKLIVNYPAVITSTTTSPLLFAMGETRTLNCEVSGLPVPKVTWSFGSTPIKSNTTARGSSVLLFKATPAQEGLYTCTASNPLKVVTGQINVMIQGPPDIPAMPVPLNATSTSVFLRLNPGPDGRSPITGYKVEYAQINDSYWYRVHVDIQTLIDAGSKGFELTRLDPLTPYEFRARAINIFGRSDYTDPTAPYWTLPELPPAPKNVKAKGKATSIEVSWKAPTLDVGMGRIVGFVVLHRRVGLTQFTEDGVNGSLSTFVIENLSKGMEYDVGMGTLSQYGRTMQGKMKFVTAETTPSVPGKPDNCLGTAAGHDSVELSWTRPTDNGGRVVTSYEVEYTLKKGQDNWQPVPGTPISSLRVVATGLTSGANYKFRVFAVNEKGSGKACNFEGQALSQSSPPTPGPLHFILVSDTIIEVGWSDPVGEGADNITAYKLQFHKAGEESWYSVSIYITANRRNLPVYDLKPKTRYEFRLIASNRGLDSGPSPIAAVNTTAVPVARVNTELSIQCTILSTSSSSFVVSWQTAAHIIATGFVVQYCERDGKCRDKVVHSGTTRQMRISSLTANTTYTVKVRIMRGQQLGKYSRPVEATTGVGSDDKAADSNMIMIIIIGAACGSAISIAIVIVCLCCRVQPGHMKSSVEESSSVATDVTHGIFRQIGDTANGSVAPAEEETLDAPVVATNSLTRPAITTTPSLLAYNLSASSVQPDTPKHPLHLPAPDATVLNNQRQEQVPQPATEGSFHGQSGRNSHVPSAIVSPNNAATAKSPSEVTDEQLPPYSGDAPETTLAMQQTDSIDAVRPGSVNSMEQKNTSSSSSPSETEKPDALSTTDSKGTLSNEPLQNEPLTVDLPTNGSLDISSLLSPSGMDGLSHDRSLSAVLEEASRASRDRSKSPHPESVHSKHSHQTGDASGTTSTSLPSAVTASTATTATTLQSHHHQHPGAYHNVSPGAYQSVSPGAYQNVSPGPPGVIVRHLGTATATGSSHHRHHRHHRRRRSRTHSPGNPRRSSRRQSPGTSTNASRQSQGPSIASQGMMSPSMPMKTFMSPVPSQHSSIVSSLGARKDPSGMTPGSPIQHTIV